MSPKMIEKLGKAAPLQNAAKPPMNINNLSFGVAYRSNSKYGTIGSGYGGPFELFPELSC